MSVDNVTAVARRGALARLGAIAAMALRAGEPTPHKLRIPLDTRRGVAILARLGVHKPSGRSVRLAACLRFVVF